MRKSSFYSLFTIMALLCFAMTAFAASPGPTKARGAPELAQPLACHTAGVAILSEQSAAPATSSGVNVCGTCHQDQSNFRTGKAYAALEAPAIFARFDAGLSGYPLVKQTTFSIATGKEGPRRMPFT